MEREWLAGDCWLWCERTRVPVLWIGPVQRDGPAAPLYACAPCIQHLTARARAHFVAKRPSLCSDSHLRSCRAPSHGRGAGPNPRRSYTPKRIPDDL